VGPGQARLPRRLRRGGAPPGRSPARRARSSPPATSASRRSAPTARSLLGPPTVFNKATSTSSTSEPCRLPPPAAEAGGGGDHAGGRHAPRLLPAPGPPGPARRVPRAPRAVWPEMLARARDAGWRNYSLFLRDDGLLVGYVETDDFEAAQAAMEATEVNARWQAEMAPFFEDLDGGAPTRASTSRGLPPRGPARRTRPEPTQTTTSTDPVTDPATARLARPAEQPSSCPPGRTATPAPGSRCSASPACPRTRSREDRGRRPGAPVHRRRAAGVAAHPVGPGRRLRRSPRTPPTSASDRRDQLQPVPGRRLQARLAHPPRPAVRRKAIDHHARVRRHHATDRVADLKLWLPDGTNYPGQDDLRGRQDRLAEALREIYAARRRPAAAARVQVLRAGVLRDRHPRLGHLATRTASRWASGAGRARHRPPRAGHQHRVHRRSAAAARAGSARSTSTALLRRRRPDRRRGRPVPAVPDHERDRPRRRLRPRAGVNFMLDQCHNIEPKIPARSAR
jgi:L-rhamnose mutarotase